LKGACGVPSAKQGRFEGARTFGQETRSGKRKKERNKVGESSKAGVLVFYLYKQT